MHQTNAEVKFPRFFQHSGNLEESFGCASCCTVFYNDSGGSCRIACQTNLAGGGSLLISKSGPRQQVVRHAEVQNNEGGNFRTSSVATHLYESAHLCGCNLSLKQDMMLKRQRAWNFDETSR